MHNKDWGVLWPGAASIYFNVLAQSAQLVLANDMWTRVSLLEPDARCRQNVGLDPKMAGI